MEGGKMLEATAIYLGVILTLGMVITAVSNLRG
jgi:hypothetical protein